MNRTEVYQIIDQERTYQDQNNLELGYQHKNSQPFVVAEELVLLQNYLNLAIKQWSGNAGDTAALHEIRKMAAIAVRCMENHGAPKRQLPSGPQVKMV